MCIVIINESTRTLILYLSIVIYQIVTHNTRCNLRGSRKHIIIHFLTTCLQQPLIKLNVHYT